MNQRNPGTGSLCFPLGRDCWMRMRLKNRLWRLAAEKVKLCLAMQKQTWRKENQSTEAIPMKSYPGTSHTFKNHVPPSASDLVLLIFVLECKNEICTFSDLDAPFSLLQYSNLAMASSGRKSKAVACYANEDLVEEDQSTEAIPMKSYPGTSNTFKKCAPPSASGNRKSLFSTWMGLQDENETKKQAMASSGRKSKALSCYAKADLEDENQSTEAIPMKSYPGTSHTLKNHVPPSASGNMKSMFSSSSGLPNENKSQAMASSGRKSKAVACYATEDLVEEDQSTEAIPMKSYPGTSNTFKKCVPPSASGNRKSLFSTWMGLQDENETKKQAMASSGRKSKALSCYAKADLEDENQSTEAIPMKSYPGTSHTLKNHVPPSASGNMKSMFSTSSGLPNENKSQAMASSGRKSKAVACYATEDLVEEDQSTEAIPMKSYPGTSNTFKKCVPPSASGNRKSLFSTWTGLQDENETKKQGMASSGRKGKAQSCYAKADLEEEDQSTEAIPMKSYPGTSHTFKNQVPPSASGNMKSMFSTSTGLQNENKSQAMASSSRKSKAVACYANEDLVEEDQSTEAIPMKSYPGTSHTFKKGVPPSASGNRKSLFSTWMELQDENENKNQAMASSGRKSKALSCYAKADLEEEDQSTEAIPMKSYPGTSHTFKKYVPPSASDDCRAEIVWGIKPKKEIWDH
ncbi:hypothetical protein POM88_015386 [Heracleum sosnowskyi]|uniref:Uncharacterized protein n=1 Tax=Heracleum sosnowskyi TaxID=360622 RepID=A0AAD8IM50_9APIA|nr:hypothetical protein POM88_015386 [Heracleum sosnowskyi]